jgi:hypothetical protein
MRSRFCDWITSFTVAINYPICQPGAPAPDPARMIDR